MSNLRSAGFVPCCPQLISLTELQFDNGTNTPNIVTTEGFDHPFGAELSVKGIVNYAQISESGGYASTPVYGYTALRTSDDPQNPGVFEFGNHGMLVNQVALSINLLNGALKASSLATGGITLVSADADGNIVSQGPMEEFADNASALAAGKTVGQFYKTGEFVKVVS